MFLEIKSIEKYYGTGENRTKVLKGITTGVEKGKICVLLGPSGSGKSTLLNIIGGIEKADGGSISTEAVKEAVGKAIGHEDVRHPLSDQAIAEKLNAQGYRVARRTVAKYREQLGLPPAHKRK